MSNTSIILNQHIKGDTDRAVTSAPSRAPEITPYDWKPKLLSRIWKIPIDIIKAIPKFRLADGFLFK
ncbi:hypothetical protein CEXT_479001 [Caerostris extrusa]|uniref:Uncharacterized protein n=1 Tax=Caerostris extrusa TaxID=172846 RepID=A0AAV4W9C7_CAEEX|nr:hypothetical protein CEXT_479001 [Caerostris extrusa]